MDVVVVVAFEDEARRRFAMVRHRVRGWELPGGRIEPDETPLEAARREFEEETGRLLSQPRFVLQRIQGPRRATVFAGTAGPPVTPRREDAVVELRFVDFLDDVTPLAFPDDDYDTIGHVLGRPMWRMGSLDTS